MLPLVEAREEPPDKQMRGDVVRPFLDLPLVAPARMMHGGGDVGNPIEAPQAFKSLTVCGVGCPGENLSQLRVEELIVLGSVEAIVGLAEQA